MNTSSFLSKYEQIAETRKLLRRAKKAYEAAQQFESELFNRLRAFGVDLEAPAPFADNADHIEDAISCFLLYGEGDENSLIANIFNRQGGKG